MAKRRRFTADFKARVALEALRGDRTIQEIAGWHKVHPNQVSVWKKQALEGLGTIFEHGTGKSEDREAQVRDLHAKIGELAVQNDFLSRALKL
jgi:transposase-like protein